LGLDWRELGIKEEFKEKLTPERLPEERHPENQISEFEKYAFFYFFLF
jgi:hypothetical protein